MLNEEPFMGLTKDSLPKDPSCCALWDLLYAYEMIGESPKRLTHMRGEFGSRRSMTSLSARVTQMRGEVWPFQYRER